MRPKRPLILLCNDDGVRSPGLAALCEAVFPLGELLVAAPSCQQTSMGRSYPRLPDGGVIEEVTIALPTGALSAFSVVGSPAACVAHGVLELADRLPDLCISGINYGENLGKTLTYSGTLGAALQAADFGIPAIAISRPAALEEIHNGAYAALDWSQAKRAAADWASRVLTEGMFPGAEVLNINLPEAAADPCAWRLTRQSRADLFAYAEPARRDFSKPYVLPTRKRRDFAGIEPDSDIYAVCVDGVVSVTPLTGAYRCAAAEPNSPSAGIRHS